MKKTIISLFLVAIMMLTFAGCGQQSAQQNEYVIYLGGLAPLTGDVAVYGIAEANGAKMAFDEINAAGGILGKQIKFDVLDEKGDVTEAVNAYARLKNNGMVALVGDVTSKPTISVAQKAAADKMPMITATATALAVTEPGDNIFRVCFIDPVQGQTMAKFAKEVLGKSTYAIIYNNADDYSVGLAEAFDAQATELGMTRVGYESYMSGDVDFKAQLTKIAGSNPEVLFVPDYYNTVSQIAQQARTDAGIDAILLGADGWDGVLSVVSGDQVANVENAYFCNHYATSDPSEKVQNFVANYKALYNEDPVSFAALGYDAAYILADAITRAQSTEKDAIIEALKTTEYDAVTGAITFDEEGNPVKDISIITIKDGAYTLSGKYTKDGTYVAE